MLLVVSWEFMCPCPMNKLKMCTCRRDFPFPPSAAPCWKSRSAKQAVDGKTQQGNPRRTYLSQWISVSVTTLYKEPRFRSVYGVCLWNRNWTGHHLSSTVCFPNLTHLTCTFHRLHGYFGFFQESFNVMMGASSLWLQAASRVHQDCSTWFPIRNIGHMTRIIWALWFSGPRFWVHPADANSNTVSAAFARWDCQVRRFDQFETGSAG